jgi:sterol desaturase/sphingolipid hydroxylase (fatty acid hydroxylase superfamily)
MGSLLRLAEQNLNFASILGLILLSSSIVISALLSFIYSDAPGTWRGFWLHFLPPSTLRHPSAHADIVFFLTRFLTNLVAILPGTAFTVIVGVAINRGLCRLVPLGPAQIGSNSTHLLVPFTITMLIAHDFSYYLYHYAQHRFPFLWELHKVHHSAEVMIGLTKYRVHPVDDLVQRLWDGLVVGVIYGVWLFFAYDPVELAIYGINIYRFRNIATLDLIRHTHYKISFGWFNNVFISPHYHQLHHSAAKQHWDRNFGLGLSIWDRMFGTLAAPEPNEEFVFGLRLTDQESAEYHSWWRLYTVPMVKMGKMMLGWICKPKLLPPLIPPPGAMAD